MNHIISGRGNSESSENLRGGVPKLVDKIRTDNQEFEENLENTREEHNKYMNKLLQNTNENIFKQKLKTRMQEKNF